MASTLKHLRSSTADKRPTASGLVDGQLAINTASGTPALFFKDNNGGVVKVGPAHVGSTAPNAVPAGSAGNSLGELWVDNSLTTPGLNYYTGSAFVNLTPSGTTTTVGLVELATPAETQTGTDAVRAVTPSGLQSKVSDSTSTTSSTTIASSTAVKSAYDLANAALPKAGGTLTGELLIGTTGSLVFEGSSDDSFETTIAVTNPTADHTITFPNVTGTVVTTGDSGTVTSTMIANDTIVNADINSAAAIVDTKLATISTADKVSASALNIDGATDIGGALENGDLFIVDDGAGGTNRKASAFRVSQLTYSGVTGDITIASGGTSAISTGVIVNADVNSSAAIDFSKLASLTSANILLGNASNVATSTAVTGDVTISNAGVTAISSGVIVNADVNASAAIAGTKISPDFGSQTITTTGVVSAALGAAATPSITFTGDLNTGIYSPGADQVAVATNGTGRLFVDANGNVSIGSSSSISAALTVVSQSNAEGINIRGRSADNIGELNFWSNDEATRYAKLSARSTYVELRGPDAGSIQFNKFDGTQFAIIDSSGRLGVGTSSPADALHLASGNFRLTNGAAFATSNTDIASIKSFAGAANQFETTRIAFRTGAFVNRGEIAFSTGDDTSLSEKVRIDYLGRLGVGTTSPSTTLDVNGGLQVTGSATGYSAGEVRLGGTGSGIDSAISTQAVGSPILFFDHRGTSNAGIFAWRNGTGAGSERMRLDGTGRLGIGTSSPSTKLEVQDNGTLVSLKYASDAGSGLLSWKNTSGTTLWSIGGGIATSQDELAFVRQGTTVAKFDSSGRLGIGTTSPGAPLEVIGTAGTIAARATTGVSSQAIQIYNNGTDSYIDSTAYGAGSGGGIVFRRNGTGEMGRFDTSGRLLVGTSTTSSNTTALLQGYGGVPTGGAHLRLAAGTSSPANGSNLGLVLFSDSEHTNCAFISADRDGGTWSGASKPTRLVFSTTADGASSPTERMRIINDGGIYIGKASGDMATKGIAFEPYATVRITTNSTSSDEVPFYLNRQSSDGNLIRFFQANTEEGSISVSGTTVSYNGAHLSRWSQLPSGAEREEILRGSVLSNIDEMCEWGEEENEQLNRMKVSDVEGDKNVSGVFQAWDDDDDTYTNDFYCAMTGDFIIRIAEGVTVERGDLLMSAGDGTAKPQDDDIIRSKTIAKVTSTNVSCTYEDGSYCVPCVLMAC